MDFHGNTLIKALMALLVALAVAGCEANGGIGAGGGAGGGGGGGNGGGGNGGGGNGDFGNAGEGFGPIGQSSATAVAEIGMGCVECEVVDVDNVLSGSDEELAVLSTSLAVLPVGGMSSVGIRVDLNSTIDSANRNPGFDVSFPDVSTLSLGAFPDLTVSTLLDGSVVDSQTYPFGIVQDSIGIGALSLLDINNAVVFLGVESTGPYNALLIELSGIAANALIDVNVHQAYVDGVSGSISGDFPI